MLQRFVFSLVLPALIAFVTTWWVQSKQDSTTSLDAEIERFLAENPRLVYKATVLAAKQVAGELADAKRESQQQFIQHAYDRRTAPVIGDPQAPATIVMFSDYQCGFCKATHPDVMQLVESGQAKLILRELPVLGAESFNAARAALAVHELWPERYSEFQQALFTNTSPTGLDFAAIATAMDLDATKLIARLENATAMDLQITHNAELAEQLEITGTPAFLIGGELHIGRMAPDELRRHVQASRSAG